MKLNNSGKSLTSFLLICVVILVCLLVAGYYCYILFGAVSEENGNSYIKLETKLTKATLKYNKTYGYENEIVSSDTLEKLGFLKNFTDIYGKSCDGYVRIDNLIYSPYIKCGNYETNGYND